MRGYLRNAIQKNHLSHALLFSGVVSPAPMDTALWLAQALFCRDKKEDEPCGVCSDCRLVDQRTHPDLVCLEPEEDSRVIKIEAIRALIARAGLSPLQAPAKLFIIDHAELLNDVAQNAFLKTLEEPQDRTYFVLISYANEKLLSTVRSRVQELRFTAQGTDGSLSEESLEAERQVTDLLLGRLNAHVTPDLADLSREEIAVVLERVMESLREALLIGIGAETVLVGRENRPRKESLAERFDRDQLMFRIEILSEFKEKINRNMNTKLALSVLWDKLNG